MKSNHDNYLCRNNSSRTKNMSLIDVQLMQEPFKRMADFAWNWKIEQDETASHVYLAIESKTGRIC